MDPPNLQYVGPSRADPGKRVPIAIFVLVLNHTCGSVCDCGVGEIYLFDDACVYWKRRGILVISPLIYVVWIFFYQVSALWINRRSEKELGRDESKGKSRESDRFGSWKFRVLWFARVFDFFFLVCTRSFRSRYDDSAVWILASVI